MYLEFFKFNRMPFSITPEPDFFYLTVSAKKAYERIIGAIRQREPYLLLNGASGTGKTALLKRLMADGDSSVRWMLINQAQLAGNELLVLIGQVLGLSEEDVGSDHFFDRLSEKIRELVSRGLYPVIVVDEADHLGREAFQKLFKWHALNQAREVALTIIVVQLIKPVPAFLEAYYEHFASSLADPCYLEKFDFQDMCAVIAYRLEIAGYSGPTLFEDEALKSIFTLSGGIPRVINLICDLGLALAANRKQRGVSPQIIQETSTYLLLDSGAGIDQDPSQKKPANRSATRKPAWRHAGRPVPKLRWAVAGLLIMLGGGGAWVLMRSARIQKALKSALPVAIQVSPNDPSKDKRNPSSFPEPSSRLPSAENSLLTSAKPLPQAVGPEPGSTPLAMVEPLPEKMPSALLHETRHPFGGIDQRSENRMVLSEEKKPGTLMGQPNDTPSLAGEMIPNPAVVKPVLRDDGKENQALAVLPNQRHPLSQADPSNSSESSGRSYSLKITDPPRSRKPHPLPKAYMAAPEPGPSRALTSEQEKAEDVQAASVAKGADLIAAVENGKPKRVQQLLDAGVNVDSFNETGETALMKAAWTGRTDMVTLLLSHAPRINRQSREGWTALFYGAVKGHKPVMVSLLAHGAKPDMADQDGRTPLMAAAWNGHADIAKLLLALGVDPNRKNREGWSPLMYAALKGHIDVVRILLRHGADPAIRNDDGDTSAELAAHQGHTHLLSLFSTHSQR